jgi:hypothetical protein
VIGKPLQGMRVPDEAGSSRCIGWAWVRERIGQDEHKIRQLRLMAGELAAFPMALSVVGHDQFQAMTMLDRSR